MSSKQHDHEYKTWYAETLREWALVLNVITEDPEYSEHATKDDWVAALIQSQALLARQISDLEKEIEDMEIENPALRD